MNPIEGTWLGIDREELRSECAAMASQGGLLAVLGDNSKGPTHAAHIAKSVFENAGLRTRHVRDAGYSRLNTVRYVLEDLARWTIEQSGLQYSGLSLQASNANTSFESFFDRVTKALRPIAESPGLAVIVTALGQDAAPDTQDLSYLARLGETVGGCWVVIGQDGKSWRAFPASRTVKLRSFTKQEVAGALRSIIQQRGGNPAGVAEYVAKNFDPAQGKISPVYAYTHLELLTYVPLENHGELL
ncbi:hypothetical protein [Streptomyces sp. 8N616]|uniref:hypothetical protein n=1 Tax=Streptomyces sp. 8N616 TaxID=3457414 RepID=UPI003FD5F26D